MKKSIGQTPELITNTSDFFREAVFSACEERNVNAGPMVLNYLVDLLQFYVATENLYDEQVGLTPPTEFKARHILVATQGEAAEIITQLDGGADFAELAMEKSTGPSGPSGGDLGWFPPERMVAEFSEAVQALEDGAYSKEPVQTQFGWHVILREESRDAAPPPFDSVRDALKQNVEGQKLQDYLESLSG